MEAADKKGLIGSLKVLYVEDEDLARSELSIFLKRRVGRLFTAVNGEEGIRAFVENNPDLVITDLKMPVMDGLEMIREIRKAGSNCPVIVISALSDSETIIKTVDLGIVKYVIKPLDTNSLLEHMEGLASDILKKQLGRIVLGDMAVLDRESKQELEKKLKSEVAHFLKNYTGKGPRDVHVFIKVDRIEVKAEGVLTIFETNLVSGNRNHSLVDYNRKLFYEENAVTFEQILGEAAASKLKLIEVRPDSAKNTDNIVFAII